MIDTGPVGRRRILSAVVFLPCFFVLVGYLPPAAFFVFVGIGILLAQYEYYRLHYTERWSGNMGTGLVLGMLVTASFAFPARISAQALITVIIQTGPPTREHQPAQ